MKTTTRIADVAVALSISTDRIIALLKDSGINVRGINEKLSDKDLALIQKHFAGDVEREMSRREREVSFKGLYKITVSPSDVDDKGEFESLALTDVSIFFNTSPEHIRTILKLSWREINESQENISEENFNFLKEYFKNQEEESDRLAHFFVNTIDFEDGLKAFVKKRRPMEEPLIIGEKYQLFLDYIKAKCMKNEEGVIIYKFAPNNEHLHGPEFEGDDANRLSGENFFSITCRKCKSVLKVEVGKLMWVDRVAEESCDLCLSCLKCGQGFYGKAFRFANSPFGHRKKDEVINAHIREIDKKVYVDLEGYYKWNGTEGWTAKENLKELQLDSTGSIEKREMDCDSGPSYEDMVMRSIDNGTSEWYGLG